uniref:Lipase_3 domain-containing protein n=1 Tax=Rhabditophanes sp. KR3021 TaxID=114890 RepID=A0AC35U4Z9_9BILA
MFLYNIFFVSFCMQIIAAYDEEFAFKAYKLAAAAYADDDQDAIVKCFNNSFPNVKVGNNFQHSTFECDKNGNTCGVVYATFLELNTTIISFRGTKTTWQLIVEAVESLEFVDYKENGIYYGKVDKYFKRATEYAYTKFLAYSQQYNALSTNIILTGHSLGGAMATMLAMKLVLDGDAKGNQIQLYTFAAPRSTDYVFARNLMEMVPNQFRVTHNRDIIPHSPSCDSNGDGCNKTPGQPYHPPTEVWYGKHDVMKIGEYVVCDSEDGEDPSCSDGDANAFKTIWDGLSAEHMQYFGYNIRAYGENGCNSSSRLKKTISLVITFLFLSFNLI